MDLSLPNKRPYQTSRFHYDYSTKKPFAVFRYGKYWYANAASESETFEDCHRFDLEQQAIRYVLIKHGEEERAKKYE